jgi:glycerol-3-phosphate dehydrogenase
MRDDREKRIAPPALSLQTRRANLDRMSREEFDLAIIGGGITGAGVALDAASRGLKAALVEKSDFSSGTSSRSSKLIHGGLRYLEQLQLGLVRESLHERATLQQIAPHLARRLPFVIPLYDPPTRSPLGSNRLKLRAGLFLYDLLAGRRRLGRHFWLPGEQVTAFASGLESSGLRGCFVYYDGLTDDSRLVIEVIKEAAARGAVVANYAAVKRIESAAVGFELGIEDSFSNGSSIVRARVVVNATGVWSDEVASLARLAVTSNLRPSKGVHIVLPFDKLPVTSAVLIPSAGEDRFLFVIPWHSRTVVGTTDSDYAGDFDDPEPTEAEISHLVESAAGYFPGSDLNRGDVISAFAGLRPLVGGGGTSTKDLSRKEKIFEGSPNLISVIGGKLTTYRRISERVVDLVCRKLNKSTGGSKTREIHLAGGPISDLELSERVQQESTRHGMDKETIANLITDYGGYYRTVLDIAEGEGLNQRLAI